MRVNFKSSLTEIFEREELIQKLINAGFGDLINALLLNEQKAYTKKGRLNKSGLCRLLGWKPKQIEDAFLKMREILKDDI